jgi:phenylalanyl-tRNA synthetase alpha chain
MEDKLDGILQSYKTKISSSLSFNELDEIFLSLFGKNGELTIIPKEFSSLSVEEKKVVGPLFNQIKQDLEKAINDKRQEIREEEYKKLDQETIDFNTQVEFKKRKGQLHPLTEFENEITRIFGELGFQRFDAPLIDTDYNNFEVLNIPEDHPARDLWDTLYIDSTKYSVPNGKLLLRTHTSNSQIHIMKNLELPIRAMNIGSVFRHENLDARHEHTFSHFELVYIDKGLSMANLQFLSEYFFKRYLGEDTEVRLRPKYYPFVEPTAGIDALCIFCKGKGCKVCGDLGWIELAGAGMIHPNVLKNGGIDPEVYTGIAWGTGLERILMVKKGINDVRLFRNGDINFLKGVGDESK